MKKRLDNTALWNEAAVAGMLFGAVSIGCLLGKEAAALSGSTVLITLVGFVLWAAEFFGCIALMRKRMIHLRDNYEGVTIAQSHSFGRRAALLSGLLLASAQALIIMKMPPETMDTMVGQVASQMQLSSSDLDSVGRVIDKLPLWTFLFQWGYCFLYGTVLSSIMSRYVFIQGLFDAANQQQDRQEPDEQ